MTWDYYEYTELVSPLKETTASENRKFELNVKTRKYYEIEEMMKLAKNYSELAAEYFCVTKAEISLFKTVEEPHKKTQLLLMDN